MPRGLGMHPYFPKAPGTMLTFDCTGVWPPDAPEAVDQGAGPMSRGSTSVRARTSATSSSTAASKAGMAAPPSRPPTAWTTRIEADGTFGKLQIYDAWDYPYICIEPVTNANDGFNRAAAGVAGPRRHRSRART